MVRDNFLNALETDTPMNEHMNAGDFKAPHFIPGFFDETIEHGDLPCRVIPDSCREIPWEHPKRNLFFLLEYREKSRFKIAFFKFFMQQAKRLLLESINRPYS